MYKDTFIKPSKCL